LKCRMRRTSRHSGAKFLDGGGNMRSPLQKLSATITILAALAIAGCGSKDSASSTVEPSSRVAQPGPAPTTGGATVAGSVLSGATSGMSVSVVGTSIRSALDGSFNFRLEHVPAGDDVIEFAGTGVNARLTITGVTSGQTIHLNVHVAGNQADTDEDKREDANNKVELEGLIADVNVAGRTLRVGSTDVSGPPGTPIRHGATPFDLSQLHLGDRIHVRAVKAGTPSTR